MDIYVARHGQTDWNVENKVCGLTDADLTDKGIEQARRLSAEMKDKGIDIIITSPLKRAYLTGKIASEELNIPILTDKRLIEQNYGIYEGVDRKNTDFLNNKRYFAYKYPDGESMMQVAYRVYGFLDEIKQTHKGKTVLVVCHGGVCRVMHTYFHDMTNEEFFNYAPQNGEVKKYIL